MRQAYILKSFTYAALEDAFNLEYSLYQFDFYGLIRKNFSVDNHDKIKQKGVEAIIAYTSF